MAFTIDAFLLSLVFLLAFGTIADGSVRRKKHQRTKYESNTTIPASLGAPPKTTEYNLYFSWDPTHFTPQTVTGHQVFGDSENICLLKLGIPSEANGSMIGTITIPTKAAEESPFEFVLSDGSAKIIFRTNGCFRQHRSDMTCPHSKLTCVKFGEAHPHHNFVKPTGIDNPEAFLQ